MNYLRTAWQTLGPRERRMATAILGVMVVGTVMEMVSIGLIVPILAALTVRPGEHAEPMRPWIERFGDPSSPWTFVMILGALVAVYALKSVVLLGSSYLQGRFVSALQASTVRRLFAIFLLQPWTFHLQRNSASLMHTINESQTLFPVYLTLMQVLSEAMVAAGLLALLVWFDPVGAAVVAGAMAIAFVAYDRVAHRWTRGWSIARLHHVKAYRRQMQRGLAGAREIKISGREREHIEEFRAHADLAARLSARQNFVETAPRTWFELLAVIAMFLLVATMAWQGKPASSIVPLLGLYATVAFRLLPTVNHVSVAMHRLRASERLLASVRANLALESELAAAPPATPIPFRDELRLEGVSFRYPDAPGDAICGIDLRIPRGAAIGLVGGSGAGKSTLVDVLLGLLPPGSGRVTVDGRDISDRVRGWQALVGYVPQSIYLVEGTIRRNVAFGIADPEIRDDAVWRALEAAQLSEFVRGLPDGIDSLVGERGVRLSGGQRQRIAIARALYHDPQVLVLDEATSSLDEDTEREVMSAVQSLYGAKTLIIVAHRLNTVASCHLLHRIEGGRIVQSGGFRDIVGRQRQGTG